MRLPILYVWQGMQRDYTALQINQQTAPGATPVPAVFPAGTTLAASVWEGSDQAVIFAPTVAWNNGGLGYETGQFQCSFPSADNLGLNPDGEYHFLLSVTDSSSITRPAFEALVKVIPTPGSYTPSPPDLVTYDYCLGMLSAGLVLTDAQIDALPGIISSASSLLRMKCNDRYFDLRTLTEWHEVENDGQIRLWQEPVQIITRLQGVPDLAMTVTNTSTSVQTSQAYFTYSGWDGGYGVNAKTATGIYLNWTSNGVVSNNSSSPITFAANPTLSQLAAAINAVGSGWSAVVNTGYSSWASTELTGGFVAQGCSPNVVSSVGAYFNILTDLDTGTLRPRGSMLYVGNQVGGNSLANRFGPGGYELLGDDGPGGDPIGVVKVTYVAGFNTIPQDVQNACVQTVKFMLELLKQELLLKSETAMDYKYELAESQVHALPGPVKEMIENRRYHFA